MMNDAFSALQRMKASKVAQVSGVFAAPARASSTPSSPQLALVPPIPTLGALEALARRAEAGKDVITDARRIASLPKWEYADLLARCQPGGDLDYTERFRVPGGTMTLKPIQNLALHWIEQKKGLVGSLAVGSGKTILSLLASQVINAQRPVLFIPHTPTGRVSVVARWRCRPARSVRLSSTRWAPLQVSPLLRVPGSCT